MDSFSVSDDDEFQPHTASTGKRRFKTPQRTKGKTPGSISTKKPRRSVQNSERQHTGRIQDTTAPVQSVLPTTGGAPGTAAAQQELRAAISVPDEAAKTDVQTPSDSGSDEPPAEASLHQLSHSSFLLCPVCAEDLGSISDTDAGRAAHVNACLDASAAASAVPTSPPADLTTYQEDGEKTPEEQEQDSMQEWYVQYTLVCRRVCSTNALLCWCTHHLFPPCCRLAQVGAVEVAAVFNDAEIDLSVLPHLNDNDLQVCHAGGTQHHGFPELAAANIEHDVMCWHQVTKQTGGAALL